MVESPATPLVPPPPLDLGQGKRRAASWTTSSFVTGRGFDISIAKAFAPTHKGGSGFCLKLNSAHRKTHVQGTCSMSMHAHTHHEGAYHDAIHVKRNAVDLRLHNIFGGFGPGAAKALHMLSRRPVDRTDYMYENSGWAAVKFKPYLGSAHLPSRQPL